jgi:hypothetical protein
MDKTQTIPKIIIISGCLASSSSLFAAEGMPGIAITGTMDNSEKMIPVLKMDYRTCVMKHMGVQAAIEQGGVATVAVTNDLPPGYIVSAKPLAEPKWEETSVGKSRIEEYFEGEKYARYTYGASHRFSDDGRCQLMEIEYVKIDLDDGEQKYRIKLEGRLSINSADGGSSSPVPMKYEYAVGSVKRQPSPVLSRAEVNRDLQKLAGLLKEHPEIMRELGKGVMPEADAADSSPPGGTGQSGPGPGNVPASGGDTMYRIKESLGYSKNTYEQPGRTMLTDSFVAGQACDIVSMENLNSRIWYWHRMNNYPASMSRPIILKKESSLADGESYKTTYEADSFRSDLDIDDVYFRPEPKLRNPGRWRHPLFDPKPQKRVQVPIPEKGSFAYDQFMLAMMIDVIQKRKDMSWKEKDEKIKSLRLAYEEGRLQNIWNRMD